MTTVTVISMSPDDLQAMLDAATARAIESVASQTGELMSKADLAAHYGVSTRTIDRRQDEYPKPCGRDRWRRADVLRFDRERASV